MVFSVGILSGWYSITMFFNYYKQWLVNIFDYHNRRVSLYLLFLLFLHRRSTYEENCTLKHAVESSVNFYFYFYFFCGRGRVMKFAEQIVFAYLYLSIYPRKKKTKFFYQCFYSSYSYLCLICISNTLSNWKIMWITQPNYCVANKEVHYFYLDFHI